MPIKSVLLTVLGFLFISATGLAATVSGETRSYIHSCGYYSGTSSDVVLSFADAALPTGTTVELIYGLEGEDVSGGGDHLVRRRVEWRGETRVAMSPDGPAAWSVKLNLATHGRSSPLYYDHLDFVFKIVSPDGAVSFDNGTESAWGFYKLKLLRATECTSPDAALPDFADAEILTVIRH